MFRLCSVNVAVRARASRAPYALSSAPVAGAFSVMKYAPIERQRAARAGRGDSRYDDRTIVSMKPFLRSYGH